MRKILKIFFWYVMRKCKFLRPVYLTRMTQTPIPLAAFLAYNFGIRRNIYWPTHNWSVVVDPQSIHIGIETSPGLMPGCYIQGTNGIIIGDYTQIAAGVSIISANHALTDNRRHLTCLPVMIGSHCWIGANAVILPGVSLGTYTIVGAGAVVTKSFNSGYQVLAGNPAKVIKILNPAECVLHRSSEEFHGFISAENFENFRNRNLKSLT
jgi:acetyltransferase-like isoleucine patch superfamily enzyme